MDRLEKNNHTRLISWVKKIKCMEYLNSFKCDCCGEDNIVKLCFHHIEGDKENKISYMRRLNFEKVKKEIIKCKVLCQNCHQELHSKSAILKDSEFKKQNKLFFMRFIGKESCEYCGYNKCIDCIDFHHTIPENKKIEFRIFRNKINDISEISDHIKSELESCKVICRNCHAYEHNGKYFTENKELIFDKLKKFKGIQSKLPVDEVIKMYKDGVKQIDIARHFKASKGTISDIIKRNKLKIFND